MKLLLLSPVPPPVGGIATWTKNILEYYSSVKENWNIFHQNTSIKNREIIDSTFFRRITGGIKDTLFIISEFKGNIRNQHPDVIHLTSSASLALFKDIILLRIAKNVKIPVIVHLRFGRIPVLARRKNWEWLLLRIVIKQSIKTIVIDEKTFNTLISCGYNNIVNIPNPISIDIEKKARMMLMNQNRREDCTAVFVGHVIPKKGVYELLHACTSNRKIRRLTIIGPYDLETKKRLESIAKNRDEGNWLKFTGSLNSHEIQKKLELASMFLFPSYTEGFPNVVIDAMAMGCPVIASDVGAIPEILSIDSDKPCGICITPSDISALSKAIDLLIKEPQKAAFMSKNGLHKVLDSYSISKICEKYEQVWKEVTVKTMNYD